MGQKPVNQSELWLQYAFWIGLFTVCTMIKQMSIYSSFPEVEYPQPFLKGQRCLLTAYECVRENLENIMEFYSFYLYSYYCRVGQWSQSYVTSGKCIVGFFCAMIQSFSTFKMFIGRRKDAILDKHLNKSTISVSFKETTSV